MVRKEELKNKDIKYLLYYPKDYKEGKKYPVFFHLHGSGNRGNDFSLFKPEESPILRQIELNDSPLQKAFCVIPLCDKDTWFDMFSELLEFTKFIYNQDYTDQSHFVGSGVSMGGYGIYQVMMSLPELFYKAIVCCGGGMYWNAGRMKNIKIRVFHGVNDNAVYPEEAYRMYNNLKNNGADVTLYIDKDCDHNIWDKTYLNNENLEWLMQ